MKRHINKLTTLYMDIGSTKLNGVLLTVTSDVSDKHMFLCDIILVLLGTGILYCF